MNREERFNMLQQYVGRRISLTANVHTMSDKNIILSDVRMNGEPLFNKMRMDNTKAWQSVQIGDGVEFTTLVNQFSTNQEDDVADDYGFPVRTIDNTQLHYNQARGIKLIQRSQNQQHC